MHQFGVERLVVEQPERVGREEGSERERRRQGDAERRSQRRGPVDPRQPRGHRREQRHERDPGRVLRRARQAQPDPGQRVVAHAAFAEHASAAEQRQRQRRERRHVVERQVRVEDRQERDRLDRRRQQAHGAAEQARARPVQQPQREHAERARGDARERVHLARVIREGVAHAARAAVGDREQVVQHVGEARRVGEVVRVQVVPEHRHRVRHEVVGLVGVVRIRQPLSHAPQAQPEPAGEDQRERRPRPAARWLSSCHRSRSSGS